MREFIVPIDIASTTLQCDHFEMIAGASAPMAFLRALITTNAVKDANEEAIKLRLTRFTGTYTTGSGTLTTPRQTAADVSAALGTVDVGALSSGTLAAIGTGGEETLGEMIINNRGGLELNFEPKGIAVLATDAIVLGTQAAATSALAWAGFMVFGEPL